MKISEFTSQANKYVKIPVKNLSDLLDQLGYALKVIGSDFSHIHTINGMAPSYYLNYAETCMERVSLTAFGYRMGIVFKDGGLFHISRTPQGADNVDYYPVSKLATAIRRIIAVKG